MSAGHCEWDDDPDVRGQCMCKWPDCGELFSDEKALVHHIVYAHRGPQDGKNRDGYFHCLWPGCTVRPTLKYGIGGVKRHIYTHTTAKPYVCETRGCRFGFYKKIELDRHVEQDHGADSQEEEEDFIAAAFAQDGEGEPKLNECRTEVGDSPPKRRRQRSAVNDTEKVHTRKRRKRKSVVRELEPDDRVPRDACQVQGEDDWSYNLTPAASSSDMDIEQPENKRSIQAEIGPKSWTQRIRQAHVCQCECSRRLRTLMDDPEIVHGESRRLLEETAGIIRGIREQLEMDPNEE